VVSYFFGSTISKNNITGNSVESFSVPNAGTIE
jgi:hypothetical protein